MPRPAIVAPGPIDTEDWLPDEEFSTFPIGSRPKQALFPPPSLALPFIDGNRRFLFKHSSSRAPEQLWSEVIAYHVGCAFDVPVPLALPAFNSKTGESGALIEWFYRDEDTRFSHAGDLLQRADPSYDRDHGTDHCFKLLIALCRSVQLAGMLDAGWREPIARYFLFDAIIGNTDRHQDNWGFTIQVVNGKGVVRLAPAFDNGTSLAHELDAVAAVGWPEVRLNGYINRGKHHIRDEAKGRRFKLVDTLPMLRDTLGVGIESLVRDLERFDVAPISEAMSQMRLFDMPNPLTEARQSLVELLLHRRPHVLLQRIA